MKPELLLRELERVAGRGNVLSSPRDLRVYRYDGHYDPQGDAHVPQAVIFPRNATELAQVMRLAHREGVPLVVRGAATNVTGGTVPVHRGLVIEMSRWTKVHNIDTVNQRVVVEPGLTNLALQNILAKQGYFYAPDPASQKVSTLGGNVGENAGGPRCLKYGVTTNHVLGMEVVLANGEIVQLGGLLEDNPGYDLTGPFVGSEGTFGIITNLMLRIMRLPEAVRTFLAVFDTMEGAGETVSQIIAAGIVPASLEFMDRLATQLIEESVHAGYPTDAAGLLLIEIDGLAQELDVQAERITKICTQAGAREVRLARSAQERDLLWTGRRSAFGATARAAPAYAVQDGTVPRTQLTAALKQVQEAATRHDVRVAVVAHSGDGNLHPLFLFDPHRPGDRERVHEAIRDVMHACVELGGTISGEHGIGTEKLEFMPLLFTPAELAAMARVKEVFDPDNLMNPGKVVSQEDLPQSVSTPPKPSATTTTSVDAERIRRDLRTLLGEDRIKPPAAAESYQVFGQVPLAVLTPSSSKEVAEILRYAHGVGAGVVPWGGGTRQSKGRPVAGPCLVLSMEKMNQVVDLDAGNLTVAVQAGITNQALQDQLRTHRLFFPLDPWPPARSTIGGELASNASGPSRLLFGTARDLVLGLKVVTAEGEVLRLGGKTVKNVTGYDLTKMYLGSWGTLGVITEATLRLQLLPPGEATLLASFPEPQGVARAVESILAAQMRPRALEVGNPSAAGELTERLALAMNQWCLLVALVGSAAALERQQRDLGQLLATSGATHIQLVNGETHHWLWQRWGSRQTGVELVGPSVKAKVSVPLTALGEVLAGIAADESVALSLTAHAGNGVILPIFSWSDGDQRAQPVVKAALRRAQEVVNQRGGFLVVEEAPPGLNDLLSELPSRTDYGLMRRLKESFDPKGILNPGKVWW